MLEQARRTSEAVDHAMTRRRFLNWIARRGAVTAGIIGAFFGTAGIARADCPAGTFSCDCGGTPKCCPLDTACRCQGTTAQCVTPRPPPAPPRKRTRSARPLPAGPRQRGEQ